MNDRVTFSVELPAAALTVQAAPPMRVSQRTVLDVLGISPGVYLAALPAFEASGGEVVRVGKARLVQPAAFLHWLAERRVLPVALASGELGDEDMSVEGAARRLGLRVAEAPGERPIAFSAKRASVRRSARAEPPGPPTPDPRGTKPRPSSKR